MYFKVDPLKVQKRKPTIENENKLSTVPYQMELKKKKNLVA